MKIRRRNEDVPSPLDGMIAAIFGVDAPTASDYGPRKKVDTFYSHEKPAEPTNTDITAQVKVTTIKPLRLPAPEGDA